MLKKQYRDAVRRLIAAEDALTAATKERDDALAATESMEQMMFGLVSSAAVTAVNLQANHIDRTKLADHAVTADGVAACGTSLALRAHKANTLA